MFQKEERINVYLNSLMEDMPKRLIKLEEEALNEGVPIIRKQSQGLLRFFLKKMKPKSVLEVGTAVGFSALFMMEYLKRDAKLTTIEKVPERIEKARENFKAFGYGKRIEFLEGDAENILLELKEKKMKYDFIFMDAAKGQYRKFLEPLLCMLAPEGMLVTDNVMQEGSIVNSRFAVTRRDRTIHERMREYLYLLTHYDGLETMIVPVGDGMALSIWDSLNAKDRE